MDILQAQHASITVAQSQLLQDITLTLHSGQLIALLGLNGAGKTTLLKLLAGLWQANTGKVLLNNVELNLFRRQTLAIQISYVPQQTHFEFAFTVWDIVMMGRNPYLGRFRPETVKDKQAVTRALERTDITHLAQRWFHELSGGEKQRVIIARSLATQANIILLDEPIASLDIAHALAILQLCRQLADEGHLILLSLHDINAALRYADQVILLHAGQLKAIGTPQQVLTTQALQTHFHLLGEPLSTHCGQSLFYFEHCLPATK
ncbi:ABC transporter ATP-binding protein [Beggiatoa leptomitoformis]|uniref:ATP-binding cassette domain-containing protein n=1 Tax=Beggiatoa leptomitoformis TaxID=288004 RepID=A0A2N9YDP5_9GAMM|nr:ABC transporter ATP-binding protein [Beggiatoa leptomitoformis]ALG68998.1 ATP-binding cassette domain-containing protein [Beggiatoa leptomitoformis]AUI68607.1 ATP-binding cassette domain-containing protein [Beggiatoa leptomitoformis]